MRPRKLVLTGLSEGGKSAADIAELPLACALKMGADQSISVKVQIAFERELA